MRIRSTKPEFWRSKTISQLEWEDRFVLKGLESYVDDNGVGKDDLALIAADVFPRDLSASPRETLARLSEAISRISDAGLIARYLADGENLVYVDKWRDIQRIDKPGRGRFPRPDGTMEYTEPVNRDSYRSPRETVASPPETLAPGTGEQGNRGTGEQGNKPPYPPKRETAADRVPAIRTTGAEKARDRFLAIPTNGSTLSRQIATAYSDSLAVPIEAKLLSDVGAAIDRCLRSEIPPDAIAAGIQEWTRSDSWAPSQIPKFVHKAANRSSGHNGVGKPTLKALDYDTAAEQLIAALETP